LVLMTVSMGVYTVAAAISQYTLVKPYVTEIAVATAKLQIESLSFVYDSTSNRYTSVAVTVRNTDTVQLTGTVYVYLYDATNTNVATGTYAGSFASGTTTTVTVTLTWTAGKTVTDLAAGRAVVQQT